MGYFGFVEYQIAALYLFAPLFFISVFVPARFWINLREFSISAKEGKFAASGVMDKLDEVAPIKDKINEVLAQLKLTVKNLSVKEQATISKNLELVSDLTGSMNSVIDEVKDEVVLASGIVDIGAPHEQSIQCYYCGQLNSNDEIFCLNCGEQLIK